MLNSLVSVASKQLRSCLFNQKSSFRALGVVGNGVIEKCRFPSGTALVVEQQTRWLRSSCCLMKEERIRVTQKRDEGAIGEKSQDLDHSLRMQSSFFPDENTHNMLVDGVRYEDLNVIHIKVTKNNTTIQMTDPKGKSLLFRTCGAEGFRNAKKGTNIAAQATGITLGMKSLAMGVRNVRIKIRGLGPGRAASLKGLQMAGLNIVSITDNTPAEINCPRPRKVRRV